MGSESNKLILIASLEEGDLFGEERSRLPLHITVLQPFTAPERSVGALSKEIRREVTGYPPIDVIGCDEDYFGSPEQVERREIRVRKIGGEGLHQLHRALLPIVTTIPGVMYDTTFAGERYSPHSTYIGDEGLEHDEVRHIDKLYLCQKLVAHDNFRDKDSVSWRFAHVFPLKGLAHDQAAS